ncbi:hypothetical protein B0O99DRAFT_688404 [Bisporella sp. PMI_857]|nr:hypothetical protein B0O99DRAFT_688404 [Bisporella sp. PMI_857]
MDPITAIGFAANILQFIDYSAKIISGAVEIYGTASGTTQESRTSEAIATEMRDFVVKLQPPNNAQFLGEERALCKLVTECESLAKQTVKLVEKLKPKIQKSKSSVLIAGFKTKWYEGERKRLEDSLSQCRAQLNLQLNYLTSSKTQMRLDALVASAKDDSTKLEYLHNQIEHLLRGIPIKCLTAGAQAQLKSLMGMPENTREVILQHRILEILAFEGMYGRYETVDDAHRKTLGWVFNDDLCDAQSEVEESVSSLEYNVPDGQPEDESKSDASPEDNVLDSQSEDKSESKATLKDKVKASARESLLYWLSSGTGIFHISGKLGSGKSTLMKYLCDHNRTKLLLGEWAGLIRSLLHDILKACPELIQDAIPDYWTKIKSTPWQIRSKSPLSDKVIRDAFSRLVSDQKLYRDRCFCFFIGGLDEYEGTHQEDAKTLVDLLRNWAILAPTNVKICVSSREYNVFMNGFSADQRIRLHDLTRSDMTHYVLDKLQHMNQQEDKLTLATAIVKNAQGIFMWVALVVKRIREQIENGANLGTLVREIDSVPKELDSLYEHVLSSLVDSDLILAYQTFSMALKLNDYMPTSYEYYLTLLSYSFLDDYMQVSAFALREEFLSRVINRGPRASRIDSARKRLNGCCRGLLEVRRDRNERETEIIRITHRSVTEFLSSPTQRDRMKLYLNGFDTVDAISQLTLAELWSRDAGHIIQISNFNHVALSLVPMRFKSKLDEPPYLFLVSLAMAWQRHQDEGHYDCDGNGFLIYQGNETRYYTIVDLVSRPATGLIMSFQGLRALRHPIYSAAFLGFYNFVQWELERDPAAIPLFTPLRLLYCILSNPECQAEQGLRDVIDCLHAHGISPQTASSLFNTCLSPITNDQKGEIYLGFGDETTEVTLWHNILLRCHCSEVINKNKTLRRFGYIVEKFLEYGADPYFYLSASNSPQPRVKMIVRSGRERREQWLKCEYTNLYECEDMSLTDLVERWGFENKTRILELIKKNELMLEDVEEYEVVPSAKEKQPVQDPLPALVTFSTAGEGDSKTSPAGTIPDGAKLPIDSGSTQHNLAEVAGNRTHKLLSLRTTISIGTLALAGAWRYTIDEYKLYLEGETGEEELRGSVFMRRDSPEKEKEESLEETVEDEGQPTDCSKTEHAMKDCEASEKDPTEKLANCNKGKKECGEDNRKCQDDLKNCNAGKKACKASKKDLTDKLAACNKEKAKNSDANKKCQDALKRANAN